MLKLADGRERLYQWDVNVQLIVEEPEGVTIKEVHFVNALSKTAAVVEVKRLERGATVEVPNILLQQPYAILAFCYCGRLTRYSAEFEVEARPKPDGYVYTETEVKTWASLDKRIRNLEENPGTGEVDPKDIADAVDTYMEAHPYEFPAATADTLGGVKAIPATDAMTEYVGIDADGKLKVQKAESGGSGGTTDHSALLNRDLPDQHPMSAITGLEEALANAGGGSGSTWRKIRTVTIPEDITTDTSGVNFAEQPSGGALFGFDTDDKGEPFKVKELIVFSNARTDGTQAGGYVYVNSAIPDNVHYLFSIGSVEVGTNSLQEYWTYIIKLDGSGFIHMRAKPVNAAANVYSDKIKNVAVDEITKLHVSKQYKDNYGFVAGSTFTFYGR